MTLETFIPFVAGAIGVPVINFLKVQFALEGKAAVVLATAVSIALAVVALLMTGGFSGESLLANAAIVFSTAQLVYKLLA